MINFKAMHKICSLSSDAIEALCEKRTRIDKEIESLYFHAYKYIHKGEREDCLKILKESDQLREMTREDLKLGTILFKICDEGIYIKEIEEAFMHGFVHNGCNYDADNCFVLKDQK